MPEVLIGILLGALGTCFGVLLTLLIGKRSDTLVCCLLSFAGGVMVSVVFLDLIPESLELSSTFVTILGLALGVIVVFVLNNIVDRVTGSGDSKLHESYEQLHHQTALIEGAKNEKRLFGSGIVMLVAIGLHNLPEGLAIGAAGGHDVQLGVTMAMIFALHNIPEGMAISGPLVASGMKKGKVVFWTMIAEAPALIGALIGFAIGSVNATLSAICLAVAGGAMLCIVFGEIIPQSVSMTKSRIPTVVALAGIVAGLLVTLI